MERQYVGIDLHRRRSVIVRKNAQGEVLSKVRIDNSPMALAEGVSKLLCASGYSIVTRKNSLPSAQAPMASTEIARPPVRSPITLPSNVRRQSDSKLKIS